MAKNHQQRAKRATRQNPRIDREAVRKPLQRDSNVVSLHTHQKPQRPLCPRNLAQEAYVDVLNDDTKAIVFATGPAGTGKTILATHYALTELRAGRVRKIVLTRPAVSVDEQHGFLPGGIVEKMLPWLAPIIDCLKEQYSPAQITKLLEDEVIEIAPLAYMRGRTFKDSIVLFDEAQNALPSQMKMVLTRIGQNSRIIVTGDMDQHDRGFADNGMKDFLDRLSRSGSDRIAVCNFAAIDVERHEVIEDVLRLYEK